MPNARRWQQSGALSRMVQTRGVAAASVVARVARASTSFSRVAPCRCPADASARATTTVSPSTRCAVRKAEAEGAECSRPWFSEPRRDCDRGADAGVEVGGCHRGFGRGRSSSAPSQGIVASGPVAGEGSSRGGSHRRDKALHREVKEARWRIARGSQSGAVKSCRRLRPSWLRWRMPFAMESCGCRHLNRETHGTPEPPLTAPADFAQELSQLRFCAGTHTGEGRSPIRIVEVMVRKRGRGRPRLVADPLQEVALGDTLAGATNRSNRGKTSSLMETLIDRADAEFSVRSNHRFNPM